MSGCTFRILVCTCEWVADVIDDEMLHDVGFLWILEEACIENTGKRGMFEDECTKNIGKQGIFEK